MAWCSLGRMASIQHGHAALRFLSEQNGYALHFSGFADTSRGCHGGISLTMACMSVNRVCIQAMQATFLRVPAARRRA